ncbi:flagellar assembly protein FliW [Treponema brennaborense]|uniref:Flagellar assembly factor FliW n=1 Tax=Treponema brennaborense (strain DSM 12168 / CIP 105900 / DD5/3) TaxID=906968 RepID=F4LIW5_TREBD|nr:flagellar assembly protein FliW [Treponema brennaborense]AEE17274.1 Flagellar assembly factor fliW [Treponema brennaborense DSM 12168]
MEVETKAQGTVCVDESQNLSFPAGLFGFESYTEFVLFESEYKPFFWLQSVQDKSLAFLVVDPFLICSEYELDVDDKTLAEIGVKSPSDVFVLAIVTVPPNGTPVTVNLQGPLIVNKRNKNCLQVILSDPQWGTKHDILAEMKKRGNLC